MFRSLSVGAMALVLAACGALKPHHGAPQNPQESISKPVFPSTGAAYRIDESRSELRILVYRAGPLARFGHNHVLLNRAIQGAGNLAPEPGTCAFWLKVPVAGFVVDDAQARREEGADFAAEIPDDAKSGTLHNMLGAALLDADRYPEISVAGAADSRAQALPAAGGGTAAVPGVAALIASVAISVAGHQSTIDVPFTLQVDSGRLSATGSIELRQSALGLTPYSLMLGALQVQDAMTLKFKIVAVPGDASAQ